MRDPAVDRLLAHVLGPELGHVPASWPGSLDRVVRRNAREAGRSEEQWLADVAARRDRAIIAELVAAATVPHTSFFRHAEQIEHLVQRVLPPIVQRGIVPKIWSAGCATGEEPYTIVLAATDAGIPVRVVATDVSEAHLDVARTGVYPARATRGLRHADPVHGWSAPPELARSIRFGAATLIGPDPALGEGPFDVVFCRNVLIYFEPRTAIAIATKLLAELKPGGVLVVAPTEVVLRAPWQRASPDAPLGVFAPGRASVAPARSLRPAPREPVPSLVRAAPLPPTADAELELAARALSSGDPEAAEAALRMLLDRAPENATAWFLLGEALAARGETSQAQTAFQRAARAADSSLRSVDHQTLARAALRRAEMLATIRS